MTAYQLCAEMSDSLSNIQCLTTLIPKLCTVNILIEEESEESGHVFLPYISCTNKWSCTMFTLTRISVLQHITSANMCFTLTFDINCVFA